MMQTLTNIFMSKNIHLQIATKKKKNYIFGCLMLTYAFSVESFCNFGFDISLGLGNLGREVNKLTSVLAWGILVAR